MKTFKVDQFNEFNSLLSEYQLKEYNKTLELAELVNQYRSCEVLIKFGEYTKGIGENETPYMHYDGCSIMISPTATIHKGHDGKYQIWDNRYNAYPELPYDKKNQIKNKFAEPNKIGVLNTKKINDWLIYWDNVCAAIDIENEKRKANVSEYLQKLADSGIKIEWWNQSDYARKGRIVRGGIELDISIEYNVVYETMKVRASSGLDNFLLISDNKYKK